MRKELCQNTSPKGALIFFLWAPGAPTSKDALLPLLTSTDLDWWFDSWCYSLHLKHLIVSLKQVLQRDDGFLWLLVFCWLFFSMSAFCPQHKCLQGNSSCGGTMPVSDRSWMTPACPLLPAQDTAAWPSSEDGPNGRNECVRAGPASCQVAAKGLWLRYFPLCQALGPLELEGTARGRMPGESSGKHSKVP